MGNTNFDKLFDLDKYETYEPIMEITPDEYVSKTQNTIREIEKAYSSCWANKMVTEEEYENSDCDNCKGFCEIKFGEQVYECINDHSEGECFIRIFDADLFVELMENIMFNSDKIAFYELLTCKVKK